MIAETTRQPRFGIVGFYVVTVLFNICLSAQLLTVGVAYFENPSWWQAHVWLVRGYSGLSLILLVWVYRMTWPRRIRILTVSMSVLLGLQFLTIHWHPPFLPVPLAIVHPLLGFSVFLVSSTLVHRVWRIVSPRPTADFLGENDD
ncbi:hypothetical protein N836_05495 [Leptolyngbya sp. Heron Island J]|nr:hypothetical protein N836_05495 [Leptolyngbya sp. Heron Island J]